MSSTTMESFDQSSHQHYVDLFDSAPAAYVVTDLHGVIVKANRAAYQMFNAAELNGKTITRFLRDHLPELIRDHAVEWESYLHPLHRPPLSVSIMVTLSRNAQQTPLELRWMLQDISRYKSIEEEFRALNTHLESRVRERTALLELEQRLRSEALARERTARVEAEILRDIGNILNSTLELSEVFRHILDNVGRVVPHDAADLMLIEKEMAYLALCKGYSNCNNVTYLDSLQFPVESTFPLDHMAHTGMPVIFPEMIRHPEWISQIGHVSKVRCFVGVPIRALGEIVGFLNLTSTIPHFFTQEHVKLLQAFSSQAAVAIQNARLHRQAKAIAVLEERQRLARDLHDAVSQSLFTSSLIADALPRLMGSKGHELPEHLEYLRRLNRGAMAEMRALLLELRPAHLVDVNLTTQLHQLADAVRGRKNTVVSVEVAGEGKIPGEVQIALYRITQEAFNNIIKHSRATEVQVSLAHDEAQVALTIRDNGRGFDSSEKKSGMGLSTMRERADGINARFDIFSEKQVGTTIQVLWSRQERGN